MVRISGPGAEGALRALTGKLPRPRHATLVEVRHPATGELLDKGLALRFPGPASASGEDVAELHLHGGRSVVAAVLEALGGLEGLRAAEAGEFTRRAFENGRIDLSEAEGLSDLLTAETQSQRRAALALAGGALSRRIEDWQRRLLALAAAVEALLDHGDEEDVGEALPAGWHDRLAELAAEMRTMLSRPRAERLREGVRVVIGGPPNAGKSSLLNVLAGRDAAITSAVAGTTRDVVEAPTAIAGTPFLLIDTAGLREAEDEVEAIGVSRARDSLAAADIILWLGDLGTCPARERAILVQPKADISPTDPEADIRVSALSGEGVEDLLRQLLDRGQRLLPQEGEVAINARHHAALRECLDQLAGAELSGDLLMIAENLRLARRSLDHITGRAGVEDMLDAMFGSFCIGK